MDYTDQDLINEVQREISANRRFRRDIEKAVRRKNRSWLHNLILGIANRIWNFVKDGVIVKVVRWFLGF